MSFVGREQEQACFQDALRAVTDNNPQPSGEGRVLLVYGHGGIGKSSLLDRYRDLATHEAVTAEAASSRRSGPFVVAHVDWDDERRRNAAGFPVTVGPPLWRVLDRLYRALVDAAVSPRDRRCIERAFTAFRRQIARMPELMDRARALGVDAAAGQRPLTEEDRRQLGDAIAQLAAAGLTASLGAAGTPVASTVTIAATAAGRGLADRRGRLEPEAYASLTAAVEALVRAFGTGLSAVGRKRGSVVVVLDTCELLGETLNWLAELVRRGGPQVLWVLGLREETDDDLSRRGLVEQAAADLPADRTVRLPLRPFTPDELADYLHREFGGELPAGVTAERMIRGTGGVPLAVSLVTSALRRGSPADEVFDDAFLDGAGRQLVTALLRRYLIHLRASPSSARDLMLVQGLALLVGTVDVDLLAALWDVPVADVAGTLERLRDSYDFVVGGSRPLHREVASAVLGYLRGPAERASVRAMNERAAAELRARLPERPSVVETRVGDVDWQRDVFALVWHTYWADARAGHRLLCHIFAPVTVLAAPFALGLSGIALEFEAEHTAADRAVLHELHAVASRPYRSEELTVELPLVLPALQEHAHGSVFTNDTDRTRFVDMLSVMHGDLFGIDPRGLLDMAESLVERAGEDDCAARRYALELHRRITGRIVSLHVAGDSAVDLQFALHAARRGTLMSPREARVHTVLALLLLSAGQPGNAETAAREALRLEPDNPHGASTLGIALHMQGNFAKARPLLRKAVSGLVPEDAWLAVLGLGRTLLMEGLTTSNRDLINEAVAQLRTADRIRPGYLDTLKPLAQALIASSQFSAAEITIRQALTLDRRADLLIQLGLVLAQLGRTDDAADVCQEAIDLEPANPDGHAGRATALGELGDHAGAERENREAIRLDPGHVTAHENLATALLLQGRRAEAMDVQRRAVRLAASRGDRNPLEIVFRQQPWPRT